MQRYIKRARVLDQHPISSQASRHLSSKESIKAHIQTYQPPSYLSINPQPDINMKNLSILTTLFLASAALVSSTSIPPKCGTCNPLSGQNHCDITTSCINTGTRFHCACRAGYKASKDNHDVSKQFRLNMPNYQFLVFTPESTECNTLCDNPYGFGPDLCAEVPIYDKCPV
jgi:hypothetical protein